MILLCANYEHTLMLTLLTNLQKTYVKIDYTCVVQNNPNINSVPNCLHLFLLCKLYWFFFTLIYIGLEPNSCAYDNNVSYINNNYWKKCM